MVDFLVHLTGQDIRLHWIRRNIIRGRTILIIAFNVVLGTFLAVVGGQLHDIFKACGETGNAVAYHWGKCSSQRMCLPLHVLQPVFDLV